ncbi:MAG: hypothetical protein AB7R90_19000 [Reyranellaceae bacterium]
MAGRRGFLLAAIYGIVAASLPLGVVMLKSSKPKSAPLAPRPAQRFTASLASAPFPYDGPTPDGSRPFFDTRDPRTRQRAHTTGDGAVLPEHPHYTDDRVLFHLPPGFDPARPFEILVFFHGHGSEIERSVGQDMDLPGQVDRARRNLVLIAPQLAREAPDSSPGKLGQPDGLKNLLDEAAPLLAQRSGGKEEAFRAAPVILSAFSGGYRSVAFSLARGGAEERIRGVLLLDAVYGDIRHFADWMLRHWHDGFFVGLAGPSTRQGQEELRAVLAQRQRRPRGWLPARIRPGVQALVEVATEHTELPKAGPPPWPLLTMLRRLRLNA